MHSAVCWAMHLSMAPWCQDWCTIIFPSPSFWCLGDHRLSLCLGFWGNCYSVPTAAALSQAPSSHAWGLWFLHILTSTRFPCLKQYYCSHLRGHKVICPCGFHLHVPCDQRHWHYFTCRMGICVSSLKTHLRPLSISEFDCLSDVLLLNSLDSKPQLEINIEDIKLSLKLLNRNSR